MSPVELPYSYRDVDGDRLAVFTDEIPGQGRGVNLRTDSHGCSIPAEDVPALVRAILAAAGDTGHEVVSASGLDSQLPDRGGDIITDLDVALATRTDLTDEHRACYEAILSRVEEIRAERDRALHAARSMRERAAAKIEYWGSGLTGSQVSAAIRALPLIPEGDTLPVEDLVEPGDEVPALAELADRVAALEERLSPPEKTGVRADMARAEAELRAALRTDVEAWDAAYDQGHADGLRMGEARAEETEARLAALEKLTSDQSDALEAQSRLIDALRADMRSAQAAIRGLGEALQGRIQVQVDPLKGRSADEWFEFGKRLRRRSMGEDE